MRRSQANTLMIVFGFLRPQYQRPVRKLLEGLLADR
jgi:hypothetical protein